MESGSLYESLQQYAGNPSLVYYPTSAINNGKVACKSALRDPADSWHTFLTSPAGNARRWEQVFLKQKRQCAYQQRRFYLPSRALLLLQVRDVQYRDQLQLTLQALQYELRVQHLVQ